MGAVFFVVIWEFYYFCHLFFYRLKNKEMVQNIKEPRIFYEDLAIAQALLKKDKKFINLFAKVVNFLNKKSKKLLLHLTGN